MKKGILSILLIVLSCNCFSQEWVNIYEDDELKLEMDRSSMKWENDRFTFWTKSTKKTVNSRRQYIRDMILFMGNRGMRTDIKKWSEYSYSLGLVVYDCLNDRTGALSVVEYTKSGRPIERISFEESAIIWGTVIPGTIESELWNTLCIEAYNDK